jgi:hypothetical protein
VNASRPPALRVVVALLVVVAVVTAAYWTNFFTSGAVQVRADSTYRAFERAFPLADGWMAGCALLAALGLWRGRSWGLLCGLLAGSSLVYLGCLDVLFNLNSNNYALESGAMLVEIVLNVGSFVIGAVLIVYLWRYREAWL